LRLLEMGAVLQVRSTSQNGADTSGEHEQQPGAGPKKGRVTPHWNALLGLLAIGVLYAFLPDKISIGPRGLLLVIEIIFLLPFVIAVLTRRSVSPVTIRVGSVILLGIVTVTLAIGIGHMIFTLPGELKGIRLLYTGLLLYACNVLLFALWYWEIDGGGPERRQQSNRYYAPVTPCEISHDGRGNACIGSSFFCGLSCHQHYLKLPEAR
jgi:hypothetical protein